MKIKGIQLLISTAAAVLLCSYILYETGYDKGVYINEVDKGKDKVLMETLMKSIQSSHYQPKDINDDFSKDVFDLYLQRIDYNKRFLMEEDIEALNAYKTMLDDQIEEGEYGFFDLSFELLKRRVREAESYYKAALAKPFDFSKQETLELDQEKRSYFNSTSELREFWRKSLKYEALTRIHEMERKQEMVSEKNDTITILSFEEMEAKARKNMERSNDRFFERMSKWTREDLKEVYLNSIMNVFGPHTGYFPPKDKENFDISMSGQLEGIGAQLQEKDGYIKVTRIIPGSPSYLQGELEEGDIIMKVAQEDGPPVDITDTRIDDAVKLIRGKKGTKVNLTIKKINGLIKEITIVRDIVVLEETYAKSAIIEENGLRVGYIKLPKFYADFNKLGGRSASIDVKNEIEKLKAEKVDGIVLDLRGNGGGSLKDAIDMTGYFIEAGPVVQVKSRFSAPDIMGDKDRSVSYEGPLVVMLNHFSASASEILAAAIQDYDRGIIIGTNSTFGKGTVQRFYELDRMLTSNQHIYRPLGAIKITTQKFYRINGNATQLKGVEADITIPSRYSFLDMGEKEQDFVMEWDKIESAGYNPWTPRYDEGLVLKNSAERIRANEQLRMIEQNARQLKEQTEQTLVSLNYDEFSDKQRILDEQEDSFEKMLEETAIELSVRNLSADLGSFSSDSVKTDINDRWLKKLKNDVVLGEAVNVVGDMTD